MGDGCEEAVLHFFEVVDIVGVGGEEYADFAVGVDSHGDAHQLVVAKNRHSGYSVFVVGKKGNELGERRHCVGIDSNDTVAGEDACLGSTLAALHVFHDYGQAHGHKALVFSHELFEDGLSHREG